MSSFDRSRWLSPAPARELLVLALDGALAGCSLWLAMMLRFEGSISEHYRLTLPAFTTLLVCYRLLANVLFRLHRWSFRFSGLADGARIGMANVFGTGLLAGTLYLMRDPGPPRSVVVLELLLSTLFMASLRFSPRLAGLYVTDWRRSRRDGAVRTLVAGAGAAGEMLLRDLQRSQAHSYHVIGFVDDDPGKRHMIVGGRAVLGALDELPSLVLQHDVAHVLIAIPRLPASKVRKILSICADLKLRFKILPGSLLHDQRRAVSAAMQDLAPEDLLSRDIVTFPDIHDPRSFAGRVALVTGAAGTLGREICAQLLRAGMPTLLMVDLNENELYLLKQRFDREHPAARTLIEIANVRDGARLRALFERYRPADVFHAAAHKHVPLMEAAPCEAVKNNVLGTRIVAEAAAACAAERFVYMSTDKAVRPTSVMGASKRLGEEILRSLAPRCTTRFCSVRFGNVLGSAGSVVPLFREQIAAGGPVSVTHPDVRRYFMTVSEAVALVLQAAYGDYGELCILDMGEPIRIADLARHMITMSGLVPDLDVRIVYSGLRPGEKLYEELLTEEEERTRRVTRKILVADCPAPPAMLEQRLDELGQTAYAEQAGRVIELLQQLVPSYTPSAGLLPCAEGMPAMAQPAPESGRRISSGQLLLRGGRSLGPRALGADASAKRG